MHFVVLQALGHTCLIEPMLDLIREAWNAPDLPRPSIYASNAAIAACARVGRMQEALDLYRDMVRVKIFPSCIPLKQYPSLPSLAQIISIAHVGIFPFLVALSQGTPGDASLRMCLSLSASYANPLKAPCRFSYFRCVSQGEGGDSC